MTNQLNPIRRPTAMQEIERSASFTKKLSTLQREWLSDSNLLNHLKNLDAHSSGNLHDNLDSLLLSFREVPIPELKGQEAAIYLQQRVAQIIATCRRDSQALVYLIQAKGGQDRQVQVRVCLGAVPSAQGLALPEVMTGAVRACLPKAQVERYKGGQPEDDPHSIQHLLQSLDSLKVWGMMTGIPALGLFSSTPQSFSPDYILRGMDSDSFTYIVVAEPMPISKIEQALDEAVREIGHIHPKIRAQLGITNTTTESQTTASAPISLQTNMLGQLAGTTTIASLLTGNIDLLATIMMLSQVRYLETQERAQESKTSGSSQEQSEGREFLNQSALFYEQALLFHAKRLLLARNQGLWQASVFLAAETPRAFEKLRALVRMTFSQRPSAREIDWNEPIQTLKLPTAGEVAKRLSLINLPINDYQIESATGIPHQLPTLYPYALATPLLTEELAALMNLPQDEYPGYRVHKEPR